MTKSILRAVGRISSLSTVLALSASSIALSVTSLAYAQDEEDGAQYDDRDSIIVTAQRREQELSKVPLSVIVHDSESLRSRNVVSEQDMGTLVPGLQVKNGQNSNQLSFSMRGQTLDPFSGTSPAVLTYLNEAPYLPNNTATSFFDLESIQVLKGPQGTLFGRNATGGAVLYSTPTPGDEFGGYAIIRGGSRDAIQAQVAVDLPLIEDTLAVRLAFDATRSDGYVTNVNTGNTFGDKNNRAGRLTVLFTPGDIVRNTTIFQYDRAKGTEGAGNIKNYNSLPTDPMDPTTQFNSDGLSQLFNNTGVFWTNTLCALYCANDGPAAPGFFPGGVEGYTLWSHENPYKVWVEYDLPHDARSYFLSNTTEIDVTDDITIKNIFSFMDGMSITPGNLAGGPFGALWLFKLAGPNATGVPGGQTFDSQIWSNELQLQGESADGRLNYVVGGFYSESDRFEIIPISIGADILPPLGVADISYAYSNKESSTAVFAQVSYELTERLTMTAGGRYTWVDVTLSQEEDNVFGVDPASAAAVQMEDFKAPAWTASLQYEINPDHMVYFSQRGSFRSGNLNGTVAPFIDPLTDRPANSFKNEKVHDFELGYKYNGYLGEIPAQLNIAAYRVIVKDAQRALYAVVGGAPAGFTVNVPEAVTNGIEVDGSFGLTDWLDLGFNVAYTDAKYTDNDVPIPFVGTLQVDSYSDSPEWAGSAIATLKLPVPENVGRMSLQGTYYGQTDTFFASTNGTSTPGTDLDGYYTLGLRFDWRDIMGSSVSAAVYARNVTDNLFHIAGYALGASSGVNTWYPGEPRTIGAELKVDF